MKSSGMFVPVACVRHGHHMVWIEDTVVTQGIKDAVVDCVRKLQKDPTRHENGCTTKNG